MNDIETRVKKLIAEHLRIDEDKVKPNASFYDDFGADSLDTVELIMALEEEFGGVIADDDAEKMLTVKDAVNIAEKLS